VVLTMIEMNGMRYSKFPQRSDMVRIKMKYVVEDKDRHGNIRHYFRRKEQPKIRLRGMPGSDEFMEAYQAALANAGKTQQQRNIRAATGSFGYVCLNYYVSPTFKALDQSTQHQRSYFLDSICEMYDDKPISKMESRHVKMLLENRRQTPAAARNFLKALQALFKWAVDNNKAKNNPTLGVEYIPYSTKGHHSWTTEEITQYEERHPLGTLASLAKAIFFYTGCRREDAVRLGPQHIRNGRLQFTQAKNEHRNPVYIDIPVHPKLADAIAACPSGHMTFLVTANGKPFTPAGFGNKFRKWCNEADLPNCSAHGLRKAMATQLAEGGASPHEIMSFTGHRSLSEVQRYTRDANKSKLADSAIAKLK
jgi:integrase/recombinase XerD